MANRKLPGDAQNEVQADRKGDGNADIQQHLMLIFCKRKKPRLRPGDLIELCGQQGQHNQKSEKTGGVQQRFGPGFQAEFLAPRNAGILPASLRPRRPRYVPTERLTTMRES
jgi:hypothetical protein